MIEYLLELAAFWKAVAILAWWLALALLGLYICASIVHAIAGSPKSRNSP